MKQKIQNVSNFKEMEINENNNMHYDTKKRKIDREFDTIDEKKTLKNEKINIKGGKNKPNEKEGSEWDVVSSTLFDDI